MLLRGRLQIMRLIKESKIRRAVINPDNHVRATGCGCYPFAKVHRLCSESGLGPAAASPHWHKSTATHPRNPDGPRRQVAEEVCERGDPQAFPRLCHCHQSHRAGVRSHRNRHGGKNSHPEPRLP